MSWKRNGDHPFNTPGLNAGGGMPMGGPPNGSQYYDDSNPYSSPPGHRPPPHMSAPSNYGYGNERFPQQQPPQQTGQSQNYQSPLDAEVDMVLNEIKNELLSLDSLGGYEQFRNTKRVMNTEITKLENNVDPEWIELDVEKEIKLVKKVLIPQYRYPRFNFVGKILGPKAQTLQNLAKKFKCHVYVLGRGSTRDRAKEQELLQSGDPNYAHYSGPLHIKIETSAPPEVAYERVAGVLDVLKKLLEPVRDTFIEGITPVHESISEGADKNEQDDDSANASQNSRPDHYDSKPSIPPQSSHSSSSHRSGMNGSSRGGGSRGRGSGANSAALAPRRGGGPGHAGGRGGGSSRGGRDEGFRGPGPMRGRGGGPPRGGSGGFSRGRGGSGGGPPKRFAPY